MNDLQLKLLIDLHRRHDRQGPGGVAETKQAMTLAGLDHSRNLKVADIGCGTGASTIQLAKELDTDMTAVDFLPEFLEELKYRAEASGVADKITTLNCSMEALPFAEESFDVIWSEGAIYNIGFESGVSAWRRFLKPGGKLIVSEITWLTAQRPAELQSHWDAEYPEIDTASAKIEILERYGYLLKGYFYLPSSCWIDNYYQPIQNEFNTFLARHDANAQAKEIIEGEKAEIALYEKYRNYYSYGFYIAEKSVEVDS